jgi:hypothetical protein
VADGTYQAEDELNHPVVDFQGKAITVRSESGPKGCVLSHGGYVARFHSGETLSSFLMGFTIRGGDPEGGIACESSSPTIAGNIITGNMCDSSHAGVIFLHESKAVLMNNFITGNDPFEGPACIVCCHGSDPTIVNNTIVANNKGGITCDEESTATVTNCILWGNGEFDASGATVVYSCLEHAVPGEGNISLDPQFVQYPADGHLQPSSPAIDAGMTAGAPPIDIEGNKRPCGGGVDMGAYEYGECLDQDVAFRRGDANSDGKRDLSDAVFTLSYLFVGGPAPSCAKSADIDDNGSMEITDPVRLLYHLFLSGPAPEAPLECGLDPTEDDLSCAAYAPCEGP